MENLDSLRSELMTAVADSADPAGLESVRIAALGKQSRDVIEKLTKEKVEAEAVKLITALADDKTRADSVAGLKALGPHAVAPLVARGLPAENKAVQNAAIDALEALTKRSFGITAEMADDKRAAAIQAWIAAGKPGAAPKPAPPKDGNGG